jgi:hypothetical protein
LTTQNLFFTTHTLRNWTQCITISEKIRQVIITILLGINDQYSSHNIVRVIKLRRMRWAGHVESMGERRGKRPHGRSRHRWEDNIKTDLQDGGCGGMDWIELPQDTDRWQALLYVVMNLWVPQNTGNFLTSREPVSFSRSTLLHGVSK